MPNSNFKEGGETFTIVDGKVKNSENQVAVVLSRPYGIGFSTDLVDKEMMFDPKIVRYILQRTNKSNIDESNKKEIISCLEDDGICDAEETLDKLSIVWINPGRKFRIHEYDGSESIEYFDENSWSIA